MMRKQKIGYFFFIILFFLFGSKSFKTRSNKLIFLHKIIKLEQLTSIKRHENFKKKIRLFVRVFYSNAQNCNFCKQLFIQTMNHCLQIEYNTSNYTFQNSNPPKAVTYFKRSCYNLLNCILLHIITKKNYISGVGT